MKKHLVFGTLLITLTGAAMAQEGGYLWEIKQQQKTAKSQNSVSVIHQSNAQDMGHTAVQHKRYVFDDEPNTSVQQNSMNAIPAQSASEHDDHFASDHKRKEVGS
ncbi:hypothetical protein BTA51_29580 [Hahella sp. CCB-MM4]|uniref:hypothetical protein n=1 Tax=Hahella sp. (strain CCB-MM4) TaxID=1926491 RepID=UPI000B9B1C4D|nr:hypothetical protein [Hahella sp. CCB-MM4]OZG69776.1 hypothetical protein BTA51_29580 [Hahella sp. CCB-MM4]